ncbi:MAG: hypothetical protein OXE78_04690 [Gammaproteobacteria bacterium]|nr:hypothetical protein [Gammaproteobacteria bacterium]MCY4356760.1 hypothetical protein [Gammaproteobacteria bacterium]
MLSWQTAELGAPLVKVKTRDSVPVGTELLIEKLVCGSATRIFTCMMAPLILVAASTGLPLIVNCSSNLK